LIEWKKQYRKYKPLAQPRKCNICQQKTVVLAYHVVCDPCAIERKICAKCQKEEEEGGLLHLELKKKDDKKEIEKLAEQLAGLPLRKQKTMLREIEQTEYLQRKERRKLKGEESDDENEELNNDSDQEEDDDDGQEEKEEIAEKTIEYENIEIEEVDEDESLIQGKIIMKKSIVTRPKIVNTEQEDESGEQSDEENSEGEY
jgi:hypothetical protein